MNLAPDDLALPPLWRLARGCAASRPSPIREILKAAEAADVISLAGGLPDADGFPAEAIRAACDRVLRDAPRAALQYAPTEGHAPLRAWIAERLRARGVAHADPARILVTSGSQQGLDLIGKALVDPGAAVAVERPTYLGALQALAPREPSLVELDGDGDGVAPHAFADAALPRAGRGAARFAYLQPTFQNPTGRCMPAARRDAVASAAQAAGVPVVEDDPYGDLWLDAAPPTPLAARWADGCVLLGSLSKVLAPGLRIGFVLAPAALHAKLVHLKQGSDLQTSTLAQRVAAEVLGGGAGFALDAHVEAVRARHRVRRDAMAAALARHLPPGCEWRVPAGGMFFWVRLPAGLDAGALLADAIGRGVVFVPGAAFHAARPDPRTLRLSFVTVAPADLERGVAILGALLRERLADASGGTGRLEHAAAEEALEGRGGR